MGLIQDFIRSRREKKDQFRRMQEVDRMENTVEERKISSDERDFLAFKEDERQKKITEIVKKIRLQKTREAWTGGKNNPVLASNMFKDEKNIFKGHNSILKNDGKLLKGGNFFFKK